MWPDLESLREEGWGKTPSPVAAASSQARPKAIVGFVTPGPSDKHEPPMGSVKEGGEMETNSGIIPTFFTAWLIYAGLFLRHFFAKSVKRLAEILSSMKILTELDAEMGEL